MSLTIRKLFVLAVIGGVFLLGNLMIVAHWLYRHGLVDWALYIRREFLTGTALAVILAMLVLLVRPSSETSPKSRLISRCPVCDHTLLGNPKYCGSCGSRV